MKIPPLMMIAITVLYLPANVSAQSLEIAAVLRHPQALHEAHDVELRGNLAFVAGKGNCIALIEITEPTSPKLLWFRQDESLLHDCETVLLDEDRLFLGSQDFHSIDVTNLAAPQFDATIVDRTRIDTINGMVRRENTIFAASKEGFLTAIDISAASLPTIAGAINTRTKYQFNYPHDVDLFGPCVVVVDPNGFGTHWGSVAIFRVFSDDEHLLPDSEWELIATISDELVNGANRVQVQGHYAYIGGSYAPKVSGGRATAKGAVIDLSEVAKPRLVASVNFPDPRGPNGLTISGKVWFLAGGQTVQAYDIRDPTAPKLLSTFRSGEAFPTADDNAHDLVYRDGYLYVTSQGDHGFVVLQVADKSIRDLAAARN